MILLKNLELITGEETTKSLVDGGEMEDYISRHVQAWVAQNFGVVCKAEVKKA